MAINGTRAGILQAENYSSFSGVIFLEILVLSLALGIYYVSWWVFGGMLFGLTVSLYIYPLNIIIMGILVTGWTIILAGFGYNIGGLPASIIFGIIGFVVAVGAHYASIGALMDLINEGKS